MEDLIAWLNWLGSLPLLGNSSDWGASLSHPTTWELLQQIIDIFLRLLGLSEFIKWVYRKSFGSRMDLLHGKIEILEDELRAERKDVEKKQEDLNTTKQALKESRKASLDHTIAAADREWRDGNDGKANRILDGWLTSNADRLADMAVAMAKFHIQHAVPDAGDHVATARRLLAMAQAVAPQNSEASTLWAEFDQLSGMLQAQAIEAEDKVIGLNSGMRPDLVATTLRDRAWYAYRDGKVRLAPLLIDRAAAIAWTERTSRRELWLHVEKDAADIQDRAGHAAEALPRVEALLREIERGVTKNNELPFPAKRLRARTLVALGRCDGAPKAIDEFASLQEATLGPRHPEVLSTRHLRAQALADLGRYDEALNEIDGFAPLREASLDPRHPAVLATRSLRLGVEIAADGNLQKLDDFRSLVDEILHQTKAVFALRARYRLARALLQKGENAEASCEAQEEIMSFDPATAPTHELIRACRNLQRPTAGEQATEHLPV